MFRQAGFIECVLACRQGTRLADFARLEGFDGRPADAATLFDTFVGLGGGIVYDFASVPTGELRKAMWLARTLGSGACRVVASTMPQTADKLTDGLVAAGDAPAVDGIGV